MKGYVHKRIVQDAVAYMRTHGDAFQKKAEDELDSLWAPIGDNLARESVDTDNYMDVQVTAQSLPWFFNHFKSLFGNNFTAFNHFINVFADSPETWRGSSGYYYQWSSKQTWDDLAMTGVVDWMNVEVDQGASNAMKLVQPWWISPKYSYTHNMNQEIRNTVFAPVSVLAHGYYKSLLSDPRTPIPVGGTVGDIQGLQLLGPALHAIGDAVVPQHIRPALGFCHQAWENTVAALVANGTIKLEARILAPILGAEPFDKWFIWKSGPASEYPAPGCFAEEYFVTRIGWMTRDKICASNNHITPKQLWRKGKGFWKQQTKALSGGRNDDGAYLYNLAVAGSIHVISRAYDDLRRLGILSKMKAGNIPVASSVSTRRGMAVVKPGSFSDEIEARVRSTFAAEETPDRPELIRAVKKLLDVDSKTKLKDMAPLIKEVGERLQDYYSETQASRHAAESMSSPGLNVSSHFGLATFRAPEAAELKDEASLGKYIDKVEEFEKRAEILIRANESAYELALEKAGKKDPTREFFGARSSERWDIMALREVFEPAPCHIPDPMPPAPVNEHVGFKEPLTTP